MLLLNNFFNLTIYLLIAFGFTYICGRSVISLPLRAWAARVNIWRYDSAGYVKVVYHPMRKLVELIECPACFGFWIGFVASLCGVALPLHNSSYLNTICLSILTSSTNLILASWIGLMHHD